MDAAHELPPRPHAARKGSARDLHRKAEEEGKKRTGNALRRRLEKPGDEQGPSGQPRATRRPGGRRRRAAWNVRRRSVLRSAGAGGARGGAASWGTPHALPPRQRCTHLNRPSSHSLNSSFTTGKPCSLTQPAAAGACINFHVNKRRACAPSGAADGRLASSREAGRQQGGWRGWLAGRAGRLCSHSRQPLTLVKAHNHFHGHPARPIDGRQLLSLPQVFAKQATAGRQQARAKAW